MRWANVQKQGLKVCNLYSGNLLDTAAATYVRDVEVYFPLNSSRIQMLAGSSGMLHSFAKNYHICFVLQYMVEVSKNLGVLALEPMGGGKKWKNFDIKEGWHTNKIMKPEPSCPGCRSGIFCFIHTTHAIWTWERVYGVRWSFHFNSFWITMSSHTQHLPLEAFPSNIRIV